MILAATVVNVAVVMAAVEAEIVADVVTAREAMPVVVKAVGMAIVAAEVSAVVVTVGAVTDAVTLLRAANRRAVATLLGAEIGLDATRDAVVAIRHAANPFVAKVDPSVNKLRVKPAIETKAARA